MYTNDRENSLYTMEKVVDFLRKLEDIEAHHLAAQLQTAYFAVEELVETGGYLSRYAMSEPTSLTHIARWDVSVRNFRGQS